MSNGETPQLRNSIQPVHPRVDVSALFDELDIYLQSRGKDKLTQHQRDEAYPGLQAIANEHFSTLSESDALTDAMIQTEVQTSGLSGGAEPVTQAVIQTAATAAKVKAWHVLAKQFLPEMFE